MVYLQQLPNLGTQFVTVLKCLERGGEQMCSFVFISGAPPEEKGRKYLDPMTQVILRLWGEVKGGW